MQLNFLTKVSDLTSAENILGTIWAGIRSLMYQVNELIYTIIIRLYNMFEAIAKAQLLNDTAIEQIAQRVGVILGIVMLFKVIFSFITYLIDPDKMEDKEAGAVSIIKKVLIVIVLLGSSNYIFNLTWKFQNYIIENKVIYKLIIPSDTELNTEDFGAVLAARTFMMFYDLEDEFKEMGNATDCETYNAFLINDIITNRNFGYGQFCLNAVDTITTTDGESVQYFIMNYNFVLQTLVGLILVYLLVSYVIQVGVRVIQLTVLQIISPMAIISYLSPKKDNMFSKWKNIYISTYIDVFLRLAVIYLVVYLSAILLDSVVETTEEGLVFWNSVGTTEDKGWITTAMILALLMFAKKAPDLLKELFPAGASKLGLGGVGFKDFVGGNLMQKGFKSIGNAGKKAIGYVGRTARGVGMAGLVGGAALVTGHGFRGGGKALLGSLKGEKFGKNFANSYKAGVDRHKEVEEMEAKGVKPSDVRKEKLYNLFHGRTKAQRVEDLENKAKSIQDKYDLIKTQALACDKNDNTYMRDANGNIIKAKSAKTLAKELAEIEKTQVNRIDIARSFDKEQIIADLRSDISGNKDLFDAFLARNNIDTNSFSSNEQLSEAIESAINKEANKVYEEKVDIAYADAIAKQDQTKRAKETELEVRINALVNNQVYSDDQCTQQIGTGVDSADMIIKEAKQSIVKLTGEVNSIGEDLSEKFVGIDAEKLITDDKVDVVSIMKTSKSVSGQTAVGELSDIKDVAKYTGNKS